MTRPQPMQFGIFDRSDMGGMSLTDEYEQRLKVVEFAGSVRAHSPRALPGIFAAQR